MPPERSPWRRFSEQPNRYGFGRIPSRTKTPNSKDSSVRSRTAERIARPGRDG